MTPAELIDIMKQDGTALCRLPGSDNAPRWGVFRGTVPCTCNMLYVNMLNIINRYKYLLKRFFSVKKMI